MDIKEQIHGLTEEMLTNLGRLVAIDSQIGIPAEGKPFGEGPAKALEEGLKIAQELGFKTVNLDNYCGYAEMGEGDEIVGIAGHLDIVPVGGDWSYDPFKLTREGDYVYGRGTTDDKGPVLEALYAMKLLRDSGVKLNKRVRLIMGCNEETGSKCMEHYNEVAEELSCGFTPDASFPCIHGEKGLLQMMAYSKNTKIISADGGFVFNAVCDSSTIVVPAEEGLKERLEAVLAETKLQEYKVTEENGQISIYAKGVPAHASTPTLGVNAIGVTFECLEKAGFKDDFVEFYNTHIGTSCDGEGIGLKFADEYGELTLCNGMIKTENDVISCTIDIRVPVTLKSDEVRRMCESRLEDENGRIEILG
ncbi:MAG: Sapep family Mn(2+)-dependent dipeptidase, partial [Blautia wexlerae]